MAVGRIINKKICLNKAVNELSPLSALAFTWTISHLDCAGRVHGDPGILRALVFPRKKDVTDEQMETFIKEWTETDLVVWYEADDDLWIQFPKFHDNQPNLRTDRESPSVIPSPEEGIEIEIRQFPEASESETPDSGGGPEQLRSNSGGTPEEVRSKSGDTPQKSVEQLRSDSGLIEFNGIQRNSKEFKKNFVAEDGAGRPPPPSEPPEPRNELEEIEIHFIAEHEALYGVKPELAFGQVRKLIKSRLKNHSVEDLKAVITAARGDTWLRKKNAFDLPTILSASVFNRLLRQARPRASPTAADWSVPDHMNPEKNPNWMEEKAVDG